MAPLNIVLLVLVLEEIPGTTTRTRINFIGLGNAQRHERRARNLPSRPGEFLNVSRRLPRLNSLRPWDSCAQMH